MSISKRSLIFVFALSAALSFFVDGRQVFAQTYSGLDMPDIYRLTQRPYVPDVEFTREERNEQRAKSRAYVKENSDAISAIKAGQGKVRDLLAGGGDVTADAEAKKFLNEYTFPSMTQTDPDSLTSLGEKRERFAKNYLNERVTGSARTKMLDFSIEKLKTLIINTTLHPSARVNAVVLLSQLTERPLLRGQAPIPSNKALGVLLATFKGENAEQFPDFVKVAALSGIKYHLELNSKAGQPINSSAKTQLLETAIELMNAAADREMEAAAYWEKRLAVQMSAFLKDPKTLPALLAILNDDTATLDLRLEVVKTLTETGAMSSDSKANSSVLLSIAKFAESSAASEADRLQTEIDQMVRRGILYANKDLAETGANFGPGASGSRNEGSGSGNRQQDFGNFGTSPGIQSTPMIELPNYQLKITRDRIRAVALICGRAIGGSKEKGLRKNLDPKGEALARETISELGTLLNRSGLGLFDLEERRDSSLPPMEEVDMNRKSSYADQMTKLLTDSSKTIGQQVSEYTGDLGAPQ